MVKQQKSEEYSNLKNISSYLGYVLLAFFFLLYASLFLIRLIAQNLYVPNAFLYDILSSLLYGDGSQILNIALIVIIELIIIHILHKKYSLKAADFLKKSDKGIDLTVKGVLWFISLNVIFSLLGGILIAIIKSITGLFPYAPDLNAPDSGNVFLLVLYVINTCVLAPVIEEIIFRGYILNLLKKFGNLFAIVASSILFGLWHSNFTQAIPLCFASMVLGFVAIKANSIVPTIIIHCVNNTTLVVFEGLSHIINKSYVDALYNLFIIIIILLGLAALMQNHNYIKLTPSQKGGLSVSKKAAAFILNPGVFMLFVYYSFQYAMLFIAKRF